MLDAASDFVRETARGWLGRRFLRGNFRDFPGVSLRSGT
jgi:hypothetical protein